ncbi:MAG: hypothetical protein LBD24_08135 [Spirochaetaceae bacterium]|nr:hypothetical protein [Spirochaetaceae bacterium]
MAPPRPPVNSLRLFQSLRLVLLSNQRLLCRGIRTLMEPSETGRRLLLLSSQRLFRARRGKRTGITLL